jgi:hypothetical protein
MGSGLKHGGPYPTQANRGLEWGTRRMSMRRFTRLTNGFSKKAENHGHMLAIYYMYYNFCRVHQTLRVTPAMEAVLSDHVWNAAELVALLECRSILHGLPQSA